MEESRPCTKDEAIQGLQKGYRKRRIRSYTLHHRHHITTYLYVGYGPLLNECICVVRPSDHIFDTTVTYLLF